MANQSITSAQNNSNDNQQLSSNTHTESDPVLAGIINDLAKLRQDCEEDYLLLIKHFK